MQGETNRTKNPLKIANKLHKRKLQYYLQHNSKNIAPFKGRNVNEKAKQTKQIIRTKLGDNRGSYQSYDKLKQYCHLTLVVLLAVNGHLA